MIFCLFYVLLCQCISKTYTQQPHCDCEPNMIQCAKPYTMWSTNTESHLFLATTNTGTLIDPTIDTKSTKRKQPHNGSQQQYQQQR